MSSQISSNVPRAIREQNDEINNSLTSLYDPYLCETPHETSQTLESAPASLDSKNHERHGFILKSKAHREDVKSMIHFYTVIFSAILPAVGLIAWLASTSERHATFTSFTGSEIGGHLTQTEAKAIDFACSALLAPLSMAALNFIWFASARVCVVNEGTGARNGIPLHSLATASSLSSGTYNPFTFFILLKGKTWRLSALVLIALGSAIGTSALCNILAYEAFTDNDTSTVEYTLRLLQDPEVRADVVFNEAIDPYATYDFNAYQQYVAGQNVSAVLDKLTFENATLDSLGGYVGANVTDASLNNIQPAVNSLLDVPGYRLSMTCARVVTNVSIEFNEDITTNFTTTTNMTNVVLPGLDDSMKSHDVCQGHYTQKMKSYIDATTYDRGFFAISGNCKEFVTFLYIDNWADSAVVHTQYGDLEPLVQSITIGLSSVETYNMTTWSIQCALFRQEGSLNYTRQTNLSWSIASSRFDKAKSIVYSRLSDWEGAPDMQDVAPAIFSNTTVECLNHTSCNLTKNISTAINNFVYASGESTKILYNVAAIDSSRDRPEYFYNVTGTAERQYYRITYVPVLLLVGLVSTIISALLSIALILAARETMSWKMFRQVDTVRLLVDSMCGGMPEDVSQIGTLENASDDHIAQWAKKYYISYTKTSEDKEATRMVIHLSPRNVATHKHEWVSTLEVDDLQQDSMDASLRRRLSPSGRSATT